jgi:hypothetical protein
VSVGLLSSESTMLHSILLLQRTFQLSAPSVLGTCHPLMALRRQTLPCSVPTQEVDGSANYCTGMYQDPGRSYDFPTPRYQLSLWAMIPRLRVGKD